MRRETREPAWRRRQEIGPGIYSLSKSWTPPPELSSAEILEVFVYSFHKPYYFFAVIDFFDVILT